MKKFKGKSDNQYRNKEENPRRKVEEKGPESAVCSDSSKDGNNDRREEDIGEEDEVVQLDY
jgi:hypothetical protein